VLHCDVPWLELDEVGIGGGVEGEYLLLLFLGCDVSGK